MKSERRHELKTNALARRLEGFPDYWREYGNKVMLVIIVFLIAYLAVRYYNDKKIRQSQDVASSLETIQTQLGTLDQIEQMSSRADPTTVAELRQEIHLRRQRRHQHVAQQLQRSEGPGAGQSGTGQPRLAPG